MRTRLDNDFRDLTVVAITALRKALDDGAAKHPAGDWREQSRVEQIEHLEAHLEKLLRGETAEDHLAHLICRAVILRALMEDD